MYSLPPTWRHGAMLSSMMSRHPVHVDVVLQASFQIMEKKLMWICTSISNGGAAHADSVIAVGLGVKALVMRLYFKHQDCQFELGAYS